MHNALQTEAAATQRSDPHPARRHSGGASRLTFTYHRLGEPVPVARSADLRIRSLLDDPAVRRAVGLGVERPLEQPLPRFGLRRLFHRSAA